MNSASIEDRPDAPVSEHTTPAGWAAAVTASGLVGSRLRAPDVPLSKREWVKLAGKVRQQRLIGLLNTAIIDGVWPATDEQAAYAMESHLEAMGQAMRLKNGPYKR